MKILVLTFSLFSMLFFAKINNISEEYKTKIEVVIGSNFSLVNDTKGKINIYTGSGFVSLNKGSKTSISCKVGKEVRWASKGKKGNVIFKIKSKMCGKTIKLSEVMD